MELQYGKYKDIADISRSIISDIESGKTKNLTCITLIKLARAFNCSIDELVEIEY